MIYFSKKISKGYEKIEAKTIKKAEDQYIVGIS